MNIPEGYTIDLVEDFRNVGGDLYHRYVSEPIDKGNYVLCKHLSVWFKDDEVTVNRQCTNTFKEQKFLCVNGSLEGQNHTIRHAETLGYAQYNRGSNWNKTANNPKCVLVYFNNLINENTTSNT